MAEPGEGGEAARGLSQRSNDAQVGDALPPFQASSKLDMKGHASSIGGDRPLRQLRLQVRQLVVSGRCRALGPDVINMFRELRVGRVEVLCRLHDDDVLGCQIATHAGEKVDVEGLLAT